MPINPSALGGTPEEQPPADEPKGRTRRTKAQMIADAVVPANDEQVDLKDSGTGAKIQRPWLVAVEMVREGKADWAEKSMKYALMKFDQEKVAGAFAEPTVEQGEPVSLEEQVLSHQAVVPPDAEVGDEVSVGSDTFRVGHGRVLIDGSRPISVDGKIVKAKRRWRRELGSGANGPWEAVPYPSPAVAPDKSESNGKGADVTVQTERQPMDVLQVGELEWKVGSGILEKIGLPDYSSLQVGPISVSRFVMDDGRRSTVQIGSREATIPTAVVEAFQEITDVVEYVARYQRGELISFLESTGALKQPVS